MKLSSKDGLLFFEFSVSVPHTGMNVTLHTRLLSHARMYFLKNRVWQGIFLGPERKGSPWTEVDAITQDSEGWSEDVTEGKFC